MKENKSEQKSEVSNENRLKKITVIQDIKLKRSLKNDSTLANKRERAPENKDGSMISL